jgi:hypothetical protein
MNDHAGKISITPRLFAVAAIVLVAFTGLSTAFSEDLPTVDQTRITMTAQDDDGVVWAVGFGFAGGVYRWEGNHWARAAVQSEGSFALGIWKGPDGGVVVAWQQMPGGVTLMGYRGDQSKLLGVLSVQAPAPRVFSTPRVFPAPPDSLWITINDGRIYRLGQDGHIKLAYTFPPGELSTYIHPPGRPAMYPPLQATSDGQGRTWFWVDSGWRYPNWRPLEGFLIYDGHSFVYHRAITGLPDATVSFLGMADEKHLLAGILRNGLYSIDTVKLEAHRIPEPEPGAFERITKIFQIGKDVYVVAYPFSEPVAETASHRLSSVLWRLRKGGWQKTLTGIDDIPDAAIASSRPWLATPEGLWLGSGGTGLWLIPSRSRVPQLVNWQQGFPLDSVNRLYALGDGRMLAVSFQPSRSVAFNTNSMLQPARPPKDVQVLNTFTSLQPDQQFRMWGILTLGDRALDEWDGEKWVAHPLPESVNPVFINGVDADSEGRIWLFPGCVQRAVGVFDPRSGSWAPYPSYQFALETQGSHPVRFVNATQDGFQPVYGPDSKIVFMGACGGVNYFDGNMWRLWNWSQMPGSPVYPFDGPAFFDQNGRLAVNIHHETWELEPRAGWHVIPYAPHSGHLLRWFAPSPPLAPPAGCSVTQSTSLTRDRLGRSWWTWQGNVYEGVVGLCRPVFNSDEPEPFIDGRLLRRVLIDGRGNVFLETLLANNRLGEYVIWSPPGPSPHTTMRLTQTAPDAVRVTFSSTASGKPLFTWRVDGGVWGTPQEQDSALIRFLSGGKHQIEAVSIDSDLRMDPIPASASVYIGIKPQQQIEVLIARLARATDDDQREVTVEALERQPAALALPALREARAKADATERWWIDAAIQQLEQNSLR